MIRKLVLTKLLVIYCVLIAIGIALDFAPIVMARTLENLMGVKVKVEDVNFYWQTFHVDELDIANPRGISLPTAMHVDDIYVTAPYYEYLTPNIHINDILMKDVYISIVFTDSKNSTGNWFTIMTNIDGGKSGRKTAYTRAVLIDELVLTNVMIDLKRYGKPVLRLKPIEKIVLKNINSAKGLPMQEISHIIIRQVMKSISGLTGISNMLSSFAEVPGDIIDTVFKPFGWLFGGGGKSESSSSESKEKKTPSGR